MNEKSQVGRSFTHGLTSRYSPPEAVDAFRLGLGFGNGIRVLLLAFALILRFRLLSLCRQPPPRPTPQLFPKRDPQDPVEQGRRRGLFGRLYRLIFRRRVPIFVKDPVDDLADPVCPKVGRPAFATDRIIDDGLSHVTSSFHGLQEVDNWDQPRYQIKNVIESVRTNPAA